MAVSAAKAQGADVVMVHLHWGEEFIAVPWPRRVRRLRTIARMGADMVICNHQHVFQGFETLEDRFICFSLGNFLFDIPQQRKFALTRESCITTCLIDKRGCYGLELTPVEIEDVGVRIAGEAAASRVFTRIDHVRRVVAGAATHAREWNRQCYTHLYLRPRKSSGQQCAHGQPKRLKDVRALVKLVKAGRITDIFRWCWTRVRWPHYRAVFLAASKYRLASWFRSSLWKRV